MSPPSTTGRIILVINMNLKLTYSENDDLFVILFFLFHGNFKFFTCKTMLMMIIMKNVEDYHNLDDDSLLG